MPNDIFLKELLHKFIEIKKRYTMNLEKNKWLQTELF